MRKMLFNLLIALYLLPFTRPASGVEFVNDGNISWMVFPSNNRWMYAPKRKYFGATYWFVALSHDSIVGRYVRSHRGDTLIYFVTYRLQMLDPTGKISVENGFVTTQIHKIFIRDRFKIPLIEIDSVSRRCGGRCNQYLPISPHSIPEWISLEVPVIRLNSMGYDVIIDRICDSMWAGMELYLSSPISPLDGYRDVSHLNTAYGEYRFVIVHHNGIDSLKPVSGVFSPFLYRCQGNVCHEFDIEFFPPKTAIFERNNGRISRWEKVTQYVIAQANGRAFPNSLRRCPALFRSLKSWQEQTVTTRVDGDRLKLQEVALFNPEVGRYRGFYGHYILQPGVIKNAKGKYCTVPDSFLVCNGQECLKYRGTQLIHHYGYSTPFDTQHQPLSDTSTHFLLWIPDEIKAYGFNGNIKLPEKQPELFHYVRKNPVFETQMFTTGLPPFLKILHSQHYFLVLEVKIVRDEGLKKIEISWVGREDVEKQGFTALSRSSAWKKWWQDPAVLLSGSYDSLFADTVSFSFGWRPFPQLSRFSDTLFWSRFPSKGTHIEYTLTDPRTGHQVVTSDTFAVLKGVSDTTCLKFAVTYTHGGQKFRSDTTTIWISKVAAERISRRKVRISWPPCPIADFYELWWKADRQRDWTIDTISGTSHVIPAKTEFTARVRAISHQMPTSWGVIGQLEPPSGLRMHVRHGRRTTVTISWKDRSSIEDGYMVKYRVGERSEYHSIRLPANSDSCVIKLPPNTRGNLEVQVSPFIIANPEEMSGSMHAARGASARITL